MLSWTKMRELRLGPCVPHHNFKPKFRVKYVRIKHRAVAWSTYGVMARCLAGDVAAGVFYGIILERSYSQASFNLIMPEAPIVWSQPVNYAFFAVLRALPQIAATALLPVLGIIAVRALIEQRRPRTPAGLG
ncbi:MAG: hypothetical protein QM780_09935 [Hyphomicrobium sp.]|uniref:hypothetical protein n=1 Tax=Hyphomicrobium sp. TaxID=82 RepID=UPI0039E3EF34